MDNRSFEIDKLSWVDIQGYAQAHTNIVMPMGSIEQHGPHLPLGTDSIIVEEIAKAACGRAAEKVSVLLTPTVVFGFSPHHLDYAGTLSLKSHQYIGLISRLIECLASKGFKRFILLNGHGANDAPLNTLVREVRRELGILAGTTSYWDLAAHEISKLRESSAGGICHACELETSLMLFLKPGLVSMKDALRYVPKSKSEYLVLDLFQKGKASFSHFVKDFSKSGVAGDPTLATKEKGRAMFELIVREVADFIIDFSGWEPSNLWELEG